MHPCEFLPSFVAWTWNGGGKQCRRDPGWPFWAGQGRVKGGAALWLGETLGLVNNSLKACAIFSGFKHYSLPLPSPPPQLNCFLTGSVWDWGYQSGLLRLGGSPPALFIQNYVYTLSQTFGVSLYGISALVFFNHLAFRTRNPSLVWHCFLHL